MAKNQVSPFIEVTPSELFNQLSMFTPVKGFHGSDDYCTTMIWGAPGLGKSSIVEQVAKALGKQLIVFRLSDRPVEDLLGIPIPYEETNVTGEKAAKFHYVRDNTLPTPGSAQAAGYPNGSILFLDEVPNADLKMLKAGYQLFLDRRLGEWRAPDDCIIICAGNRAIDRGATTNLPAPVTNRISHYYLKFDHDDFMKYALGNNDRKILWHPAVIGFLNQYPQHIIDENLKDYNPNEPFPSPRMWEKFNSKLLHASEPETFKLKPGVTARNIHIECQGCVGVGVAHHFMTYFKLQDAIPDHNEYLAGKIEVPALNEVGPLYMFILNMCHRIKYLQDKCGTEKITLANKDKDKNVKAFFFALDRFFKFIVEISDKERLKKGQELRRDLALVGAKFLAKIFKISHEMLEMENFKLFTLANSDFV